MNWKAVEEATPPAKTKVLACDAKHPQFGVRILSFDRREGWHNEKGVIHVGITHWQELPEIPSGSPA